MVLCCVLPCSYDNPDGTPGLLDSSGFRIQYTDKLRPHDMGACVGGPPRADAAALLVPPADALLWVQRGLCQGFVHRCCPCWCSRWACRHPDAGHLRHCATPGAGRPLHHPQPVPRHLHPAVPWPAECHQHIPPHVGCGHAGMVHLPAPALSLARVMCAKGIPAMSLLRMLTSNPLHRPCTRLRTASRLHTPADSHQPALPCLAGT
jgi:hypothetical protein